MVAYEHEDCNVSDVQWSYDELAGYTSAYGSNEGNGYDNVGCLSVLIVGCVLFLYSATHLIYVLVTESIGDAGPKYEPLTQEDGFQDGFQDDDAGGPDKVEQNAP